jgi:hypothetical protein
MAVRLTMTKKEARPMGAKQATKRIVDKVPSRSILTSSACCSAKCCTICCWTIEVKTKKAMKNRAGQAILIIDIQLGITVDNRHNSRLLGNTWVNLCQALACSARRPKSGPTTAHGLRQVARYRKSRLHWAGWNLAQTARKRRPRARKLPAARPASFGGSSPASPRSGR